MKKAILFFVTCVLLISCKKNNSDDTGSTGLQEFPQSWIFTMDEAPDKYVYLRTNTANMFRKSVLQSYSLTQLAIDEDCEFEWRNREMKPITKTVFPYVLLKIKKYGWVLLLPATSRKCICML